MTTCSVLSSDGFRGSRMLYDDFQTLIFQNLFAIALNEVLTPQAFPIWRLCFQKVWLSAWREVVAEVRTSEERLYILKMFHLESLLLKDALFKAIAFQTQFKLLFLGWIYSLLEIPWNIYSLRVIERPILTNALKSVHVALDPVNLFITFIPV